MGMSDKNIDSKAAAISQGTKDSPETTASILERTKSSSIAFMKRMASDVKSIAYPPKINDKTGWKMRPENKEIMK